MIPVSIFRGQRVAVFGLARSGIASARALLAGGADVTVWDDGVAGQDRARADGLPLVGLHEADWSQFQALILAPGVPLTHPAPHWTVLRAKEAGVPVIGDTELFFKQHAADGAKSKIIGITGTNGKSTTTALTAHLLKEAGFRTAMGGNIGEAVLGLPPFAETDAYVIELSSYQIDLSPSIHCHAAALLNITPDHLDRHGTLEHYAAVKARIFSNMRADDTAVIGADDAHCRAIAAALSGPRVVPVSVEQRIEAPGISGADNRLFEGEVELADLAGNDALRGPHNWQNAAAAFALARAAGADPDRLRAGLKSFPGLAHRMQVVRRIGNVLFVNDSKATNADAAAKALAAYDDIYWIAGGLSKEGGLAGLELYFPKIRRAYLVGKASVEFARQIGPAIPHRDLETIAAAVAAAAGDAAGDGSQSPVVLLSPACASFDQFKDFEQRGNAFTAAVAALPEGGSR